MPERRKEARVTAEIEVRLSALNENGTPFTQSVRMKNLSLSGGLVSGINHRLRCGDLIRVQYRDTYSRFRVVWIANSAHGPFTAAIHKVKDDPCPWAEALTESAAGISNC